MKVYILMDNTSSISSSESIYGVYLSEEKANFEWDRLDDHFKDDAHLEEHEIIE
jgi:hypothetical protein